MPEPWRSSLDPYVELLRRVVDGRASGEELETEFLSLYKQDETVRPPAVFDVLDGFFADVDAFCPDPGLRATVGGIDESQLERRAGVALARLSALPVGDGSGRSGRP